MGRRNVSAALAGGLAVATLTACAGAGSGKNQAAPVGATTTMSTAASAVDATTSSPTTATSPTGYQPPTLRPALLPAAAFASGVAFDTGSPKSHDYPDGIAVAPNLADTSCERLFLGGSDEDARSYASATMARADRSGLSFAEAIRKYDAHGGEALIGLIQQQSRACATQTTKASNGKPLIHHLTLTAKPGLGDAALLVEDVTSLQGYPNRLFDGLIVRHGDVVITVSVAGTAGDVHAYNLAEKARLIATNLKLG